MAICTYDTAARVLLFYCYYSEFYSTPGTGILMHGKCDMIFFFCSRRLRKVKKYMWMLLYVQRGFHGREFWANAVDENLVFLNHPFAIHKILCKHFAHVQIIFVMCISNYLFDSSGHYSSTTKKNNQIYIMQPNINKKNPEWIKTTLHTQFTVLPHKFECAHGPAGKNWCSLDFDSHCREHKKGFSI